MSIEFIKSEVNYYTGRNIGDQEAMEILDFVEMNPGVSLAEIVADYYGCEC